MKTFLLGTGIVLVALAVIAYLVSFAIDPFIRGRLESDMNQKLVGYHTRVGSAHLQLLGGALSLKHVIVVQNAHPSPPVADLQLLSVSIQWSQLLSGHIVASALLADPRLHINLAQLRAEKSNPRSMRKEGWQDALQNIYPFKINRFHIGNGDIVYVDTDPSRPLHVEHLDLTADNIRNIKSANGTYPSSLRARAVVFGAGQALVDGNANFLEEPFPGVRAKIELRDIPLSPFAPEIRRINLELAQGTLYGQGVIEYSPKIERAEIYSAEVRKLSAEYIHTAETAAAERRRAEESKEAAKKAANRPGLILKIDQLQLTDSNLGFTNHGKAPGYRLFISKLEGRITNLSNQSRQGDSVMAMHGMFMGNAATTLVGTFRPEKAGPDFDLRLAIEKGDLTSLNDLLRSYGRLEIAGGNYSIFSEVTVRQGMMQGYVKPLFSNIEVYSSKQEKGKSLLHKAYEAAVGLAAKVLKNRSTQRVATQVNISGRLDNPSASTWQAIVQFIRNGFIRAILPGFDRETRRPAPQPIR